MFGYLSSNAANVSCSNFVSSGFPPQPLNVISTISSVGAFGVVSSFFSVPVSSDDEEHPVNTLPKTSVVTANVPNHFFNFHPVITPFKFVFSTKYI